MASSRKSESSSDDDGPHEIAIVGELTEIESDVTQKLLEVPVGGECTLYFDCPGGSAYSAISLLTLIAVRQLRATGIVTGECSSAAVWPFAACRRRLVTPFSVLLFHPLRWQSEEHIGLAEAAEWARHFRQLEGDMDQLLASYLELPLDRLTTWMQPGRYISGSEFAAAGLAELIDLIALRPTASKRKR